MGETEAKRHTARRVAPNARARKPGVGVGGGQRPGDAAYNQSNTLEMYFKYVSSSVITHCGFNMHTFM